MVYSIEFDSQKIKLLKITYHAGQVIFLNKFFEHITY